MVVRSHQLGTGLIVSSQAGQTNGAMLTIEIILSEHHGHRRHSCRHWLPPHPGRIGRAIVEIHLAVIILVALHAITVLDVNAHTDPILRLEQHLPVSVLLSALEPVQRGNEIFRERPGIRRIFPYWLPSNGR